MDLLLGITAALFVFSLFWAALMDVRRGEVPNAVWIPAICAFPLAAYRLALAQLVLSYTLQVGFMFALMLLCFHLRLLGGADGKAILLMSLSYPWLEIDCLLLTIGPALVCLGAWVIAGVEALGIGLQNLYQWHRCSAPQRQVSQPQKKRFWVTRRLSSPAQATNPPSWNMVSIPLVLYVFVAYLILLASSRVV